MNLKPTNLKTPKNPENLAKPLKILNLQRAYTRHLDAVGLQYIGMVPMAALVAVLWTVCLETFAFRAWANVANVPLTDVATMAAVTLVTLTKDLATGVFAGVIISALAFTWNMQTVRGVEPRKVGRYVGSRKKKVNTTLTHVKIR